MKEAVTNDLRNPLTALCAAREYIERGWCRNALALNSLGWSSGCLSPDAVSWCAVGAVGAALNVPHPVDSRVGIACISALGAQVEGYEGFWPNDPLGKVVNFNNAGPTHQPDVLGLFDKAIAANRGYAFAAFREAALTALNDLTEAK